MADKSKKILYTVEINDKGKIKIDNLTKGFVNASNAVKNLNKDLMQQGQIMQQNTRTNQNMIDKTGLAGATLVEFGRTISDANYGIRGIANNLSQLSTLFITLVSTSGGFKGALTALGNVFRGPIGLILLFQTAITLLERFSMNSKKVEDGLEKIKIKSEQTRQELEGYFTVLSDFNLSQERRLNLESQLIKKLPDIDKLNTKSKEGIDQLRESIELYIRQQEIRAEIDLLVEQNAEGFIEDRKRRAVLEQLRLEEDQKKQVEIIKKNTSLFDRLAIEAMGADGKGLIARIIEGDRYDTTDLRKGFEEFVNQEGSGVAAARKRIAELTAELIEYQKQLKGRKGDKNKFVREQLEALDPFFTKFFFDIDKSGKVTAKSIVESLSEVTNIYGDINKIAGEGVEELSQLGEDFNDLQKRNEESLKNGLNFIKQQAKDITGLFKASQQSLKFVGDTILSYHDARMEALKRERDYVLQSGQLTGAAQKKAIEDIERREIKAQERKIKAERDLFTIKQSLLIAEEIMKIKADFAERKRMFEQQTVYFINAQGRIVAKAAESTADATFSIGEFARQLGPIGIATYAVTIGGLIASIMSARKKAQASLSSLGAPSLGGGGGGGGIEAPDFNVVGASPESQLAQSVLGQQQKPLRAFVVHKDIKTADELDRNTAKSLG